MKNMEIIGVGVGMLSLLISAYAIWRARARVRVSASVSYNGRYISNEAIALRTLNLGREAIRLTRTRLWFPDRFERRQWIEVAPLQENETNSVVLRSDLPKRLEGGDECVVVLDVAVLIRAMQTGNTSWFIDEYDYYQNELAPVAVSFFDALGNEYRSELPSKAWRKIWERALKKASEVANPLTLKTRYERKPNSA